MLRRAGEDTHRKEMAELSPGLEGDRETWPGKEQDLKATEQEERNAGCSVF